MQEESNGSEASSFSPTSEIRNVQSKIQAELENFEKAPEETFVKTSYVCENMRYHILNYRDEPHLSKNQNNHRRIFIASELFINFCPIYAHSVDHEYAKLIKEMVQWEKFGKLSRKITSKMMLEMRREKYFSGEAQSKLLTGLEDTTVEEINEVAPTDREERDSETVIRHEDEPVPTGLQQIEATTPSREMNVALAPPLLESSFRSEFASITGNLSQIRAESVADATQLEIPISNISHQELAVPNLDAEISIGAPNIPQKTNGDDISKILQILEEEIFPKETDEIQQPEILSEPADKPQEPETIDENPPINDKPADASEGSEKWSLPSLEAVERTRKKRRYLIIDEETIIHDYASRALLLNRNISVQRIQVFEGPPTVLQVMSANHLMTTPSHKNSLLRDVRSSKLSTLYNRHLDVEKRPVEQVILQKRGVEPRDIDITKLRANTEIMEEVGMREGMHSRLEKSAALVEVPEKGPPEEPDIMPVIIPHKESLVGLPMSRIINSTIEPPEEDQMCRINTAPILPTPRVQQLQGKTLDVRTSPPLFIYTKESPPSAKYREFSYVLDKLQQYWSIFENQGMEKCITMREFFSFEGSGSVADYLTVFRIVDKMSIQRKLLLEYKNKDLVIRPFESPYISDLQLLLREKEPVF